MRKIDYIIGKDYDGKTVKSYLKGCARLSSRLIASLKRVDNGITLNSEHIRTVDIIHEGDVLSVFMPDDKNEIEPTFGKLDIVYEDEDILVVNKSPTVAVHPTHNHQGDTLANDVAGYFTQKGKNISFRAIGRLDKGTSGLIILALNRYTASRLSETDIEKTYFAVAEGEYCNTGVIDRPIYRPDPMKTLRAVGDKGSRAVTRWEALFTDGKRTFLKINLETGRTHQIRVHFASVGTPLTGDRMYGREIEEITHQALHCGEIQFIHPVKNEKIILSAPPPEDMQKIINSINFNKKY